MLTPIPKKLAESKVTTIYKDGTMTVQKKDEGYYVNADYLFQAASLIAPVKRCSYKELNIQSGQKILDAGCGPAVDSLPISAMTGQQGITVGIDLDFQMVKNACKRASASETKSPFHSQSDVISLPFKNEFFDGCRSERLFQHLSSPEKALKEMVRVTKKEGRIVVVDTDHSASSVDTSEYDAEWVLRRLHTDRFQHGYSGRTLYRLFREAGLEDIKITPFALHTTSFQLFSLVSEMNALLVLAIKDGVLTEEEIGRFTANLQENDSRGTFFGTMNIVVASATVPK